MYTFCTIPETDLAFSSNLEKGVFLELPKSRYSIISYDSLTMLTTLLDPFLMIFNNKKSFMVYYLATACLLLGQKLSFQKKNHIFE